MQIVHFAYGEFLKAISHLVIYFCRINRNEQIAGLGAFISPFIVEPFLLNKETDSDLVVAETATEFVYFNSTESTTTVLSLLDQNHTESDSASLKGTPADIMIQWPFIIAGIYYFVTLLVFVLVMILWPENEIHPSRRLSIAEDDTNAKKDSFKLKEPLSKKLRIFVVMVATLSMHAYVGLEISFGSLLSPYAVKSNLHMTKSEG